MRDLKFIIIFLLIILFSGLGISYFKEGLNCANGQYNSYGICCAIGQYNGNGKCLQKPSTFNPNNGIVIIFLVILIVWLVMIKQDT